jgi:hypothetical protein
LGNFTEAKHLGDGVGVGGGGDGIRMNFGEIGRGRVNWCRMISSDMFL